MKPSIFRKSEQIDSVKKLIIKGYLTWEDFRYLSNIDIKSVYIEGELNDDDKKKEHHRFARNVMSGSREVKYIDGNDRDRIQVDTLFVPTMNQLKSRVCGFFHPKFIYIQNNGILVLNSWTEDIKQIDQVDQINIGAFAGTKIKEITIPSKVRTIPAFCFQFCSDLKTVILNDSISTIGTQAFYGTNITNITLPVGLKKLSYDAFRSCKFEKCKINTPTPPKMTVTENKTWYYYHEEWLKTFERCIIEIPKDSYTNYKTNEFWTDFTMGEDRGKRAYNIILNKPGTILSHLPISTLATIDSLTITGFMYGAEMRVIRKCVSLKYLDLSHAFICITPAQEQLNEHSAYIQLLGTAAEIAYKEKKISIENLAKQGLAELCKSATEFKEANQNCYVFKNSFYGLAQLKTVKLPLRAVVIGDCAFQDCVNLEKVEFPPYIQFIGEEAFANCTKLKIEKLPSTITKLYNSAFAGCISLDWIDLRSCRMEGNFTLNIFSRANLKGIYLPQGIQSVDGSISDAQVFFPNSIKETKAYFYNCKLHFQSQIPPRDEGGGKHNIFYIPKGSLSAYFTRFGDKTYIEEAGW